MVSGELCMLAVSKKETLRCVDRIRDVEIEQKQQFKYLRSVLTEDGKSDTKDCKMPLKAEKNIKQKQAMCIKIKEKSNNMLYKMLLKYFPHITPRNASHVIVKH